MQLFRTFEHTAFRLEVRNSYSVSYERKRFDQFLAGEQEESSAEREGWLSIVGDAARDGRRFMRVRVVDLPLNDYSRWLYERAKDNNAAGEDIRYLRRESALEAELPNHDYWLFDSRLLLRMHFDDEDRLIGREIIEDPAEIVRHNYWRDVGWHYAARRDEFVTEEQFGRT